MTKASLAMPFKRLADSLGQPLNPAEATNRSRSAETV
jgi:hypothetical protein